MENDKTNNEQKIEQQNSCEISINAKGQFSGKVKAYGHTLEEAMTTTLAHAMQLEILIKEKNQG